MYADSARIFTALVLPWVGGGYCNVHWKRRDGTWAGQAFKDLDAMMRLICWLQQQPGADVYACMSSQRVATEKVGKNGRPYWRAERHVADAVELKSLFIDVDVKKCAYATTEEAIVALKAFLAATGMPRPMLMVASGGGGFHVHWLFDPPLPPDLWLLLAKALKNACKVHGLITDEGVTADAARILRVPGTLNYKYAPPRAVEFYSEPLCNNYSATYLEGVLAPYEVTPGSVITPAITPKITIGVIASPLNQDLTAGLAPQFVFAWFASAAAHVANLSPSPWELETGGAGLYADWLDFRFACVYAEIAHPHHAEDVRKLFADVMAKVGRVPEKNWPDYERALARTPDRIKASQKVTTPGTVFKFAEKHGWPPPWASPANGNAARIPLDHKQEHALKVAKQRLSDAFLIAQKIGRHRIRGDLVREARLVRDESVRARLMFALAADLRKSGHSDPEEIIDTIIACGMTRAHAAFVVAWAAKNIQQGNAA